MALPNERDTRICCLAEDRWKDMEPTDAAVQWLRQGIPNVPRAESRVR